MNETYTIELQVIQLSRYLKDGNYLDSPTPPPSPQIDTHKQDYQNILEQKSYVEEINEKLRQVNITDYCLATVPFRFNKFYYVLCCHL